MPKQVNSADIEVIYDGNDITEMVQSVKWIGDVSKVARKLEFDVVNVTPDRNAFLIEFEHGKEIRFSNNGSELFRGVLFSLNTKQSGEMSLTAYEESMYLTKSKDDRKFKSVKASEIVKRLCKDFDVPLGEVADTGYVIPKLILADKTLYDMMVIAITETEKHTGKRYHLSMKDGKVTLKERKEQLTKWVIEQGVNLISADYSQSIEDLRTQVKVVGGDKKSEIIAQVKSDSLAQKFGVMQHSESAGKDVNKSQVEQLARQLLDDLGTINDDASIEALGNPEVVAGSAIYVREETTGIVGGYYVSTDEHTFESGNHTMSISLSATDDLPKMKYESPTNENSMKASNGGGGSTNTESQASTETSEDGKISGALLAKYEEIYGEGDV